MDHQTTARHKPRMLLVLVATLVAGIAAQAIAATTTGTSLDLPGLPAIRLTVDAATTGDVVATDTGTLFGKRCQIIRVVSNGETKFVLVRIQKASNGLFIDEIAAETTTALATRINAFSLAATSTGHPSPTHDAADDEVAAAMVGYTGS